MSEKKSLNQEQLNKVSGGKDQNGKWYFCYYHIVREEYVGQWTGPYDSENDYVQFASEHPIKDPGEYEIKKMFMPFTGRTINSYL